MSAKRLTQEEKVLMALFKAPEHSPITPIGRQLGLTDKSFRHAVHLLLHGNFIVRGGPDMIRVTEHGKKLCAILQEQG